MAPRSGPRRSDRGDSLALGSCSSRNGPDAGVLGDSIQNRKRIAPIGNASECRFERQVTVPVGTTYQIEFKVQGTTIGQCLTGAQPIVYAAEGAAISSASAPN
jgi:hypothetical protein